MTGYVLAGGRYEEATASRAFPFVTPQALSEFLARGLAEGRRSAAHAFRTWVRAQRRPAS